MLQTLKAKRRGEVASLRKGKGTQRSRPFQYSKAHAKVEEEKGRLKLLAACCEELQRKQFLLLLSIFAR